MTILWPQGPAYYLLFRADAVELLDLAKRHDAIVWITVDSDGCPQPLLMPMPRAVVH